MMNVKKLTASALAAGLLLTMAAPAFANNEPQYSVAIQRMNDLGVVIGDENGDLQLDKTITRAEMVTTIVRSFGRGDAAVANKDAAYEDVKADEWYAGWVAEAKKLAGEKEVALGTSATTFHPTGKVSLIEALVFVMKFSGMQPAETSEVWYDAWLDLAVEQGLVTEEGAAAIKAEGLTAGTRQQAFELLDAGYSAQTPEGASLYNLFVDPVKPELELTVPETTTDAVITLAGTATDNKKVASVKVNGEAVALEAGAFEVEVALEVGANEITVVVTDVAGNVTTVTYAVERTEVEENTGAEENSGAEAGADTGTEAGESL